MKDLYKLKLHESIKISTEAEYLYGKDKDSHYVSYVITRVPGGWLYRASYKDISPTFVPFNNEFQKIE